MAFEREPGWSEKEAILRAMVEIYPSAYAYNNLGLVFTNQANRTQNTKERNQLLENALFAFNRSNGLFENPYAVHNLGIVFWLWKDKFSAYTNFYRAIALTNSDDLLKVHQAALGAVSIFNGDYRLAVIHLNKADKNPVNLFNQGLANVLMGDDYNATLQFENSAIRNMGNGFPFYGLAIIAARNGEEMKLYENLRKAITRSDFLRNRAAGDFEFAAYYEHVGFKEVLRAKKSD
jgi:tetratricopeptide (TPR) repeat protein